MDEGAGWPAEARVSDSQGPVFHIKGRAETNREQKLRAQLKGILVAISAAEGGLQKVETLCQAGLLAKLGAYKAEAEAMLSLLDKQSPCFEDTVRINDALQTIGSDARLQGSLNLAKHIARDAASGGSVWKRKYLLTQTPSMESVYPELVCAEDACKGVRLELAANERRSFQIQVVAPWEPLSQVKVEADALKSTSGAEISGKQVQIRQLGYLHSPNTQFSSGGTGSDRRWFPDPLVGNAPFDVKPGLAKTLWVSVDVPAGTPPGDYTGILRVAPEEKPATEVPISVKVWNFTLPEVPTLRVWSWFCPHFGRLNLMDLKNYEDFFKDFSRYKVGLDPVLSAYLDKPIKQIKVFKNSDGRFTNDATLRNDCGSWNPWPYDTVMVSTESPEVGKFIYQHEKSPGQWTWIPSVRLDNWRDGSEDYEYLHMVDTMRERLACFTGAISEVDRRRLLDQAQALLNLEELIPGDDVFAWNHDYKPYQTRRHALGEWLDAVSNILGSGNK